VRDCATKQEVNSIRFSSCSATFQFRRRSDTWAASSVFAMRLTITSAWSRMRPREEQAWKLVSAGRLRGTHRAVEAGFRLGDNRTFDLHTGI